MMNFFFFHFLCYSQITTTTLRCRPGVHKFSKNLGDLKILDIRRVTRTEDTRILCAKGQNLVVPANRCPGFLHSCCIYISSITRTNTMC